MARQKQGKAGKLKDVYISRSGVHLPGEPVDNDRIEEVLGMVHGRPSRLRKRILKSNGIRTRHYAIDSQHNTRISNAAMAALAGQACLEGSGLDVDDIDMLSCATSQGDMVLPGFASMVQAAMGLRDLEIHSCHGICTSGMMALKAAYLSLRCGEHNNALVVASELASRLFKASRYEAVQGEAVDFNAEFLRWMLSDGAGALLLHNSATTHNAAYRVRIEWIRGFSHADAYPVCMGVGSAADDGPTWQDYPSYAEAEAAGALLLRQDVRLLDDVVKCGVDGFLRLLAEGCIRVADINHVLCHYSSEYFRSRIFNMLEMAGVGIPGERWFTNLHTRGNTGCASIFIMLDEFLASGKARPGESILCMVPESGRFNSVFMLLQVME